MQISSTFDQLQHVDENFKATIVRALWQALYLGYVQYLGMFYVICVTEECNYVPAPCFGLPSLGNHAHVFAVFRT